MAYGLKWNMGPKGSRRNIYIGLNGPIRDSARAKESKQDVVFSPHPILQTADHQTTTTAFQPLVLAIRRHVAIPRTMREDYVKHPPPLACISLSLAP